MQQIKHNWTWTSGIERDVCFCLTILQGALGMPVLLILHSKNRVKLAAVQLFSSTYNAKCCPWLQKLKRHILSHRTCALSHCAVEDYVNFPSGYVSSTMSLAAGRATLSLQSVTWSLQGLLGNICFLLEYTHWWYNKGKKTEYMSLET